MKILLCVCLCFGQLATESQVYKGALVGLFQISLNYHTSFLQAPRTTLLQASTSIAHLSIPMDIYSLKQTAVQQTQSINCNISLKSGLGVFILFQLLGFFLSVCLENQYLEVVVLNSPSQDYT